VGEEPDGFVVEPVRAQAVPASDLGRVPSYGFLGVDGGVDVGSGLAVVDKAECSVTDDDVFAPIPSAAIASASSDIKATTLSWSKEPRSRSSWFAIRS
jgi:hypothetical protein